MRTVTKIKQKQKDGHMTYHNHHAFGLFTARIPRRSAMPCSSRYHGNPCAKICVKILPSGTCRAFPLEARKATFVF